MRNVVTATAAAALLALCAGQEEVARAIRGVEDERDLQGAYDDYEYTLEWYEDEQGIELSADDLAKPGGKDKKDKAKKQKCSNKCCPQARLRQLADDFLRRILPGGKDDKKDDDDDDAVAAPGADGAADGAADEDKKDKKDKKGKCILPGAAEAARPGGKKEKKPKCLCAEDGKSPADPNAPGGQIPGTAGATGGSDNTVAIVGGVAGAAVLAGGLYIRSKRVKPASPQHDMAAYYQ